MGTRSLHHEVASVVCVYRYLSFLQVTYFVDVPKFIIFIHNPLSFYWMMGASYLTLAGLQCTCVDQSCLELFLPTSLNDKFWAS